MWAESAKNMCSFSLVFCLYVLGGQAAHSLRVSAEDSASASPSPPPVRHCAFGEDLCDLAPVESYEDDWERANALDRVPSSEVVCEFEEDLCDFTLEDGQGEWLWTFYNDPEADIIRPQRDHTYNTGYGKYLAAPLRASKHGLVGSVVTPKYFLEESIQCLTFWYLHNGHSSKDSLTVRVKHGFDVLPKATWSETNNHMSTWLEANIPIPIGYMSFQVVWEAHQKWRDQEGYIAIDDVKLLSHECPAIGSCTFETGTCGWQNLNGNVTMTEDTNDWFQGSGDNNVNHDSPQADHHNDTSGIFLYMDGPLPGTAILESQLLVPEQHNDFCFSFWYFMEGETDGTVTITAVTASGKETLLWKEGVSGVAGDWAQGQIRVKATQFIFEEVAYQLFIRGTRTLNKTRIALDDFTFKKRIECPRVPDPPITELITEVPPDSTPSPCELWSCNFTGSDACGMVRTGEAEWNLMSWANTSQHNQDLYCLGLFGLEHEEGRAALPHLAAQENLCCLSFWYIIESANRGNLSVALTSDGSKKSKTLWSRTEPEGNIWIYANVHVPLDGSAVVEFMGVVGSQNDGILGIDDILLLNDVCDSVSPDSDWCDFEETGACGFSTQPGLGDWAWITPSKDNSTALAPHTPTDHTYQTQYGHYMEVVLVKVGHMGVTGFLKSPWTFQPENAQLCVSFWYVHNGAANVDTLSVFANISGDLGRPLWKEKGSYINTWLSASVPIPGGEERGVQVVWKAWQGKRDSHTTMAVDDVRITRQPCPTLGSCTFTTGTCGWQNVPPREGEIQESVWVLGSGYTGVDLDAPDADHNGDPQGMFLYVDSTFGKTGQAVLESQVFVHQQFNDLCFHFWYFLKGTNATLIVEMEEEGLLRQKVWHQGATSEQWEEGQVHVKAESLLISQSYQIFITGRRWPEYAIVAIDDFNFTIYSHECPVLPQIPTTLPSTTPAGQGTVSCDFSADQCGWENIYSYPLTWIHDNELHQMKLRRLGIGSTGQLMAELRSPTFTHTHNTICLSLSWLMHSQMDAHIGVALESAEGHILAYLMSDNGGSGGLWQRSSMEINQGRTIRIAIIATITDAWDGVMAFTNVVLENKLCSEG